MSGLKPALKYVFNVIGALRTTTRKASRLFLEPLSFFFFVVLMLLQVLAQRHPWFESCVKYNEEIFHSVMYVLERHFLREHG